MARIVIQYAGFTQKIWLDKMTNEPSQVCPICGVKIVKAPGGDRVLFSVGFPGTRARLWARVCQFVKKPGCINSDPALIGETQPKDHYTDHYKPQ